MNVIYNRIDIRLRMMTLSRSILLAIYKVFHSIYGHSDIANFHWVCQAILPKAVSRDRLPDNIDFRIHCASIFTMCAYKGYIFGGSKA